jgi:uncharacterized protein
MASPTRVGLISDTHVPERWPQVPGPVRDHFAGVDLILHAGDVGELSVLDELSHMAPVVAVHGNDETQEATAALPYQQLICLAGQRVLVCHSHQQDRTAEMASGLSDDWEPKLQRRADQARQHGASIYVFGHTHIPMARQIRGVLMVNPGAVASANALCRQTVQSVALLEIPSAGDPSVEYVRLDGASDANVPPMDYSRPFSYAHSRVSESIATAQLESAYRRARAAGSVSRGSYRMSC